MPQSSPVDILYDASGNPLFVTSGSAVPVSVLPVGGSDGTNARFISVDSSGRLIIVQATASNLNATVTQGPGSGSAATFWFTRITDGTNSVSVTAASALKVDGSAVTQPVSGTVTTTQGTGAAAGAPWSVELSDGAAFYTGAKTGQFPSALVGGRLDANVGAWLGSTAPTVGSKTSANSVPVVIASDQGAVAVTAAQATPANLNATVTQGPGSGSVATFWYTRVTDGTNTMPTGDTVARAIFEKITDGTSTAAVKAASTAAVATDPALVVAVSPNNSVAITAATLPLPTGAATSANQTTVGSQTTKINDGTNTSAVKAASTAAVATDPALVVSISPNTPIIVGVSQSDLTATGTLNALNATVQLAIAGANSTGMQLAAGTLIGTIVSEVSFDGGTTWAATSFDDPASGNKSASVVFASSNTATARTIVGVGGTSHVRVRVSAFTSGTATCNLRGATVHDPSTLFGGPPNSTTQPPALAQIGGWDGTTLRAANVKAGSTAPVAGDQALVVVLSPNQPAIPVTTSPSTSTPTLTFGDIVLSSVTTSAIRRTTYTEQVANFTGSVVSSSANDTAAGTGARTIRITYVDSTGATAGTETATLNGTTAVNLVTTTKCFIEKIEVLTVGSTGSNVGVITLKSGAAGAGTTIWTIAATDNETFGCHHYVVTGKTCNVTNATHGNNSTVSGGASVAFIRGISLNTANAVEKQVSDFIGVGGATNQVTVAYGSTIQIAGPARLTMYVTTGSGSSITYRGAIDCYDA